jgi:hypothetical protein
MTGAIGWAVTVATLAGGTGTPCRAQAAALSTRSAHANPPADRYLALSHATADFCPAVEHAATVL